jgi:hypothetical protein
VVAHYLFKAMGWDAADGPALRDLADGLLEVRMWGVAEDEPHRDALAPGDLALLYLGAPERVFIGRTQLASPVHSWTASEAQAYPGDATGGVLLGRVEAWDPAVPMETVLLHMDPSQKAKADFDRGVVRITATEYKTALAVAAGE